jgi:hypothetical protein
VLGGSEEEEDTDAAADSMDGVACTVGTPAAAAAVEEADGVVLELVGAPPQCGLVNVGPVMVAADVSTLSKESIRRMMNE